MELEELPEKKDLQKSIQGYEQAIAKVEEEAKTLGALPKMKKKEEITKIQQLAQKCKEKHINLNNLIQPHQVKITELVDSIEKKVTEFKASHGVAESTEDPLVTTIMLTIAHECVAGMDSNLAKHKEKFRQTAQEAKDKL